MTNDAPKLALCVKLAQPAPTLRYGPPGDAFEFRGPGMAAMTPATEVSMTITHYRVVTRPAFFDTLGLDEQGAHRLPHSPVASADVIFRDREGREIGRMEWAYDADGDASVRRQQFPVASPAQLAENASLWL